MRARKYSRKAKAYRKKENNIQYIISKMLSQNLYRIQNYSQMIVF
jgi:hypothetical protein